MWTLKLTPLNYAHHGARSGSYASRRSKMAQTLDDLLLRAALVEIAHDFYARNWACTQGNLFALQICHNHPCFLND
jgi:hypothetical protein